MNSACRIWIKNETRVLFQSKKWVRVVSNSLIFLICTSMIDNQRNIVALQRVFFFKSFFVVYRARGLHQIQRTFFPDLEHEAGPIPESLINLTYVLETVHSQKIPLPEQCWTGRPPKSRRSIFNAFVAKA